MIDDPIAQGVQRYSIVRKARPASKGACLSILRGRDRGRFPLRQGGADEVGPTPNEEATTPHEGKSARSRRVGKERGVCGVARLARGTTTGRAARLASAPSPCQRGSRRILRQAPRLFSGRFP